MPAKSPRQYNLMAMVANNPDAAKRTGISQSVAREMVHKTPPKTRKMFSKNKD